MQTTPRTCSCCNTIRAVGAVYPASHWARLASAKPAAPVAFRGSYAAALAHFGCPVKLARGGGTTGSPAEWIASK